MQYVEYLLIFLWLHQPLALLKDFIYQLNVETNNSSRFSVGLKWHLQQEALCTHCKPDGDSVMLVELLPLLILKRQTWNKHQEIYL